MPANRFSGDTAFDVVETNESNPHPEGLEQEEQIGWVMFDGDEYHDFRYADPSDKKNDKKIRDGGFIPVYAKVKK